MVLFLGGGGNRGFKKNDFVLPYNRCGKFYEASATARRPYFLKLKGRDAALQCVCLAPSAADGQTDLKALSKCSLVPAIRNGPRRAPGAEPAEAAPAASSPRTGHTTIEQQDSSELLTTPPQKGLLHPAVVLGIVLVNGTLGRGSDADPPDTRAHDPEARRDGRLAHKHAPARLAEGGDLLLGLAPRVAAVSAHGGARGGGAPRECSQGIHGAEN